MTNVVPFPQARRVGAIRTAAAVLSKRHGVEADDYWKSVIRATAAQMEAAGVSADIIDRELHDFARALFGEIRRSSQPGGDAA